MSRTPNLPLAVAGYFAADTLDANAVAAHFTEDAVVADEGHEHRGRAAIAAWKAASTAKYRYTTDVLSSETAGEHVSVRAKVTGNFPGSPVVLGYAFQLQGEKIRRLRIG